LTVITTPLKRAAYYSSPLFLITMENQLRISHFDLVYPFGVPSIKALLAYSPFLRDFEASQNYQIDCHG